MSASKPISDIFGTNASLEVDGIWVDYGEHGRFRVARAGGKNKAFRNLMEKRLRPYRAAMSMGTMDDTVVERITRECFAEAVVLDWELVDGDEQPITFTREKCVELFEEYPDLFLDIMQQAQMVVNFVEETREADAKGSGSS